jgi:regulator of replication initiation timing
VANWQNLEKQLEQASGPYKEMEPPEIYNMRQALIQWPGMKLVLERLISENQRLNKEIDTYLSRLQKVHEEDREYADAYRQLLRRGEIPEGRPGMPRDSMG